MDFIERLRGKSPRTKTTIAFATSAVVTLVIFGVWVSVLRFGTYPSRESSTAAVANSSDTDVDPFSAFWDVVSKGWDGLTDNINQIKTGVEGAKNFVNELGSATSTDPAAADPQSASEVFILDDIAQ